MMYGKSYEFAIDCVVRNELRKIRGDFFRRHIGLEVEEVVCENSGPDYIDCVNVGYFCSALQQLAPGGQLLYGAFGRGEDLNPNPGLLCKQV